MREKKNIQEQYSLMANGKNIMGIMHIILMILFAIIILVIAPYLPDDKPYHIKSHLKRQGYDVNNIDFTYVSAEEDGRKWIYKSSEAIFYEGDNVDYWLIEQQKLQYTAYYYVKPYIDD